MEVKGQEVNPSPRNSITLPKESTLKPKPIIRRRLSKPPKIEKPESEISLPPVDKPSTPVKEEAKVVAVEEEVVKKSNDRLTVEQLELLEKVTGPFKYRDPHILFLLGSKIQLPNKKAMMDDEFKKVKTALALKKLKEKYKNKLHARLTGLEEVKRFIVTCIETLESMHSLYQHLIQENALLKSQHSEWMNSSNSRVAEKVEQNEQMEADILKAQEDRVIQRKNISKWFMEFQASEVERMRDITDAANEKQRKWNATLLEYDRILEFSKLDPQVAAKRLTMEKNRCIKLKAQLKSIEAQMRERFKNEEMEVEKSFLDRNIRLINDAESGLNEFLSTRTTSAYKTNHRLKHEIDMQLKEQESLTQVIHQEIARQKLLKSKPAATAKKPPCDPDMDIILSGTNDRLASF